MTKSKKILLLIIGVLIISSTVVYYYSTTDKVMGVSRHNGDSGNLIEEALNGKKSDAIQNEIAELKELKPDNVPNESKHFDIEVVVRDFSDGRVDVEITIDKPKVKMNQVIISGFLGEDSLLSLNSPHSLVSNILSVQESENDDFSENFNMGPGSEIKGITASSNSIYFDGENLESLLEKIPHIIIKVSWMDENNKQQAEYIKFPQDEFIIKTKND